jgi:hypothetical protein
MAVAVRTENRRFLNKSFGYTVVSDSSYSDNESAYSSNNEYSSFELPWGNFHPTAWSLSINACSPYPTQLSSFSSDEQRQDAALDMAEYRGFTLTELGEINVKYLKEFLFIKCSYKFLLLQKCESNNYYPDPYLIICPELELEGIGNTKEAALEDIYQLLDIYYNETRKISKDVQDHLAIISAKSEEKNEWKDSINQFFREMQKSDSFPYESYDHRIITGE